MSSSYKDRLATLEKAIVQMEEIRNRVEPIHGEYVAYEKEITTTLSRLISSYIQILREIIDIFHSSGMSNTYEKLKNALDRVEDRYRNARNKESPSELMSVYSELDSFGSRSLAIALSAFGDFLEKFMEP